MNMDCPQASDGPIATDDVTLDLLRAIESDPRQTQRGLATRMGIALGLTNAVLRRAVAKGLVKVSTAPARRYAYYLTPQGFAEKSRLTLQFIEHSLHVVRETRDAFATEAATCQRQGWTRLAILGPGEMADLALMGAQEAGIQPVALIVPEQAGQTRSGVPVVADVAAARDLADGRTLDALLLTTMLDAATRRATAESAGLAPDRLLAPAFLRPPEASELPDPPPFDDGSDRAGP
ncbi:winged helix-turn-helix transcriptional regulator [Roseospira navarrensis]|uniref:Winged helix-turn-helix transcriptional regulator n=1 Tax=Roseospira navarrensis TaxID=140058 RepID=A0A7X1ZF55_9PROT|nr:winged helix-turn-helix transcriptional regulator [Roseospira navarrensis]MQX37430.1 winged helix-turn-helix transcriptional regulator [Roseospira navarrensis]